MLSPISSALSGLNAASNRIAASADNIANQFSKNYTPKAITQVSLGNGGIQSQVRNVEPPTTTIFNPSDPDANADGSVQLPNVDVANELVNITVASYDFKANLKTIKVADNMQKYLLDILT